MDARLESFARGRGGVFASGQARAVGVGPEQLRRLRRRGEVVTVRRDAYVLASCWEAAHPELRLALRTRAVLATRPMDAASHQAVLALHGLPLHAVALDVVDVASAVDRVRSSPGLRRHPRLPGVGRVVLGRAVCLPVEVALVQVIARSGLPAALVCLDAALHSGVTRLAAVAGAVDILPAGSRAATSVAAALVRADAAAESPGETLTRMVLVDDELEVRSQVEIRSPGGRLVGRVDLLVAGRVVVEYDGAVKYSGADGRRALVAEKRREDAIRALGYPVVRFTWADLQRPGMVVALVRRALAGLSASGRDIALP